MKIIRKITSLFRMLSSTRFLVRRLQMRFVMEEVLGGKFPITIDVGAGSAPYKKFVNHEKYIGVDMENSANLENFILQDINHGLPFDNDMADLVIFTETLEHTKEPAFVVKELYRILKPGGKLVLTTPLIWPVHESQNDFYRFTNFGVEYLLEQAGFKSIKIEPSNGYLYSMCQLAIIRLRRRIFAPIVIAMNILGFLIDKIEKNKDLALVQHAVAYKN